MPKSKPIDIEIRREGITKETRNALLQKDNTYSLFGKWHTLAKDEKGIPFLEIGPVPPPRPEEPAPKPSPELDFLFKMLADHANEQPDLPSSRETKKLLEECGYDHRSAEEQAQETAFLDALKKHGIERNTILILDKDGKEVRRINPA